MSSIQFTDKDRDASGRIAIEPRSLADLLPSREEAKQTTIQPDKLSKKEVAATACLILAGIFVIAYAVSTPATVRPQPTVVPTLAATPAATAAPTTMSTPVLVVSYFDYRNPETATEIDHSKIERVVGQAGAWRLVVVEGARVWVEETQAEGVPADSPLPDLAPRPTAVYVAPVSPPQPVIQPTQCAEVGIPGKMTSACGYDDLATLQAQAQAAWLEQYGGNVGIIGAPTPQVRQP